MTWFSWFLFIVCVLLWLRVIKLSEIVKRVKQADNLLEKQRQSIIDLCYQIEQQDNLIEELNYKLTKKTLGRRNNYKPNIQQFTQDFEQNDDLSLTETEIVEIYNSDATSLLSNLIKVSVKQESTIRTNENEPILLASIGNGNYCILHNKDITYWLLPKPNLKIDRYRYETVKLLFDCRGYDLEHNSFKLEKPAQVFLLPNEREWKLEERGELKFLNLLYGELVETYNSISKDLVPNIVAKVSQPTNNKGQVILKKAVSYSYLVVDGENDNCWLLPSHQIKINNSKYQKMLLLFDCDGYTENYSSFMLIEPAKVSAIAEKIHWQLEKRGKLKFI